MPPLLWTCDDPMYPGPMHKIAYTYRTADNYTGNPAVYGQISSENYYDGTTVGAPVSTLTVPSATTRIETRGDGKTRTFTYTTDGYLTSCTDFMTPSHTASQNYDGYKYITYVIDFNGHRTDFINDSITGNVLTVQFPLTGEDTPGQGTRPIINYSYTNNYCLHTIQGENGQTTTILRDSSNRITEIDYPDGGKETFPSYNSFNQVLTHGIVTGGTETFTYDGRGVRQDYRNPDNASGNPTARYQYDNYDRVSGITDVLGASAGDGNHTTCFAYNLRGQVTLTTLPTDNGTRHTIINAYNDTGNNNGSNNNNSGDGTLVSVTDPLNHQTTYTYDDYRRLKSVTPPDRNDGTGLHTTHFYYDASGTGDDYRYTDSNVTWVVLPSGKKTNILYYDNRVRQSVTVGYGTSDAAITSYGYDGVGNVTSVTNPLGHNNVSTLYDERNRPYSITVGGQTTNVTYDTLGRKSSI
jgi:YD repeat-containing protein